MAKKLTLQEQARFKELLVRLRGVISGDISELETDAFPPSGERPSVDNPADNGSDAFAQEFSLELLRRDEETLVQIDEALARLGTGEYGRCQSCEQWIPRPRLRAVPYASYCVGCQAQAEKDE